MCARGAKSFLLELPAKFFAEEARTRSLIADEFRFEFTQQLVKLVKPQLAGGCLIGQIFDALSVLAVEIAPTHAAPLHPAFVNSRSCSRQLAMERCYRRVARIVRANVEASVAMRCSFATAFRMSVVVPALRCSTISARSRWISLIVSFIRSFTPRWSVSLF